MSESGRTPEPGRARSRFPRSRGRQRGCGRWSAGLAVLCLALAAPAGLAAQEEDEPADDAQADTLRGDRPLPPRLRDPVPGRPDTLPALRPQPRPADPDSVPVAPAGAAPAERAEVRAPRTAQTDSVMEALRRLEGYIVTTYGGSAARFDADSGDVALEGAAALEREGQTITADSLLTFDRGSGIVCGYGSPVLSGEGSPVSSEQICYDTEQRMGMAVGARTQFQQDATWYVHGERVFTAGSDVLYSAGAEFTTCDLEIPHYHFRASSFKMVNERLLVARDVTLNFGDVPVFWLPFLVQSLRQGRRSGLLTPAFGVADIVQTGSGNTREVRNIGVFWAINDYMGSELAMDWRSGDWMAVRGRFDYRWLRQFLQGYVNAQQYFRDNGARELTLNTNNSWQPTERTQVSVNGRYASSSRFVEQNSWNPQELNRSLGSNASITHRFDWGSASLGASREQQILEERISTMLPSANLSLSGITLAAPQIGGERRELVWNGSTSYRSVFEDRNELGSATRTDRDGRTQTAALSSSFRFGDLNFSQSLNAQDAHLEAKPAVPVEEDSLTLPLSPTTTRDLGWNVGLSYQQNLIGSLRITPTLSLRGRILESERTGDEPVSAPITTNFGATMSADVFGFWPGVGPFERFRHRISPSIAYTYRPEPNQSLFQDSIFGETTREANEITLSFSQTFEAKRPAEQAGDSAQDSASDDEASTSGEPRRLQGQQPVRLLSITTSAIAYDFAAESRGEEGLKTTTIRNRIASDLLKDLSLDFQHSLFRPITDGAGVEIDRTFDLHLEQVSASFGLSGDSWLFSWLRIGGEREAETATEEAIDTLDTDQFMPGSGRGIVPGGSSSGGMESMGRVGSTGTWRADFNYSLQRPRDPALDENQMLNARVAFQPTESWSVGWTTGYSISDSEFLNNQITLTRSLHRWQADFSIVRAQNGNFSFEFEARLSDLPDLRVPYDQRTRGNRTQN